MLQDTKTYLPVTDKRRNPVSSTTNLLQRKSGDLKTSGNLTEKEYFKIQPSDPVPAAFYGLSKVHKVQLKVKDDHYTLSSPSPPIRLRPINISIGSPTYHVSKYLADLVSPLRSDHGYIDKASRFRTDSDSQTRRGNGIFRRCIPVYLYSCRCSLKSHPKQAGVESHLERQDKPDRKSNCGADEIRTAQQLLFI